MGRGKRGVLLPFNPIRIERETSKFPIHTLAKRGSVNIDIRGRDKAGNDFRWQVSPSRNHGEPRELAYKLDTLVINRRIEQAGATKPKFIKLGSLRSICKELGINAGSTNDVKAALRQNAHAAITAKLRYLAKDGTERTLEADFHRYSVIMTGECLPNGHKADAVYLILNDVYREVLNTAGTRPLDYDYLKQLPPTAQRFYELVSPQVFAAIKYRLPCARYAYSNFCLYTTLTRYLEWEKVKKQLHKVLKPHKASGYLDSVHFESMVDPSAQPDWCMCLVPGLKAKAEFELFTQRSNRGAKPLALERDQDDADDQLVLHQGLLSELIAEVVKKT